MADKTNTNWILLRGLTRESGHWGEFVPQLSKAFSKARIYALDLPGTGVFFKDKSPSTVPAITAQIRAAALSNGWLETPVNVLGVSLGGMVALDWLQTHPSEINSGVLINISIGGLSPWYQRLRWQCLPELISASLHGNVFDRELAIIKLISNRTSHYEALAQSWSHIQSGRPVSAKNTLAQLLAAARYRPGDSKPAMPILLLNSAGDRLVAPGCTTAISQLWRLPYKTHPWAGHDLSTDDGKWVITQILNWLNSADY
jgi:pimeloyl-ACP methyl ester carboxylesterase